MQALVKRTYEFRKTCVRKFVSKKTFDSVKCCVRHCGSYSEFFEVSVGLKQGETLSPILFSLSIEDLELYNKHM